MNELDANLVKMTSYYKSDARNPLSTCRPAQGSGLRLRNQREQRSEMQIMIIAAAIK